MFPILWIGMTELTAVTVLGHTHQKELHASKAARVTITHNHVPQLPHLRLVALANEQLDRGTIDAILALTDTLLEEEKPFKSTWDLRQCRVPGMTVVWRCIRWAVTRKAKLDQLNQRMAICMPDRPALLAIVKLVLKTFGPICPVLVSTNEDECDTFMRESTSTLTTDQTSPSVEHI